MRSAISPRNGGQALLMVLLLGFGLGISGVAAHSRLIRSDPAARAALDKAPKELKLWFNEAVEPAFAKISIVPSQGPEISLTSRGDSSEKRLLISALPSDLPPGPVNIVYHVLSVDGHTIEGKLSFTIKAPA